MITALTFLFKARDLSEKTFKAHFHVVPRAHHKLHLSAWSFLSVFTWGLRGHFLGKQNARGFLKLELPKFDRDYFKFNFIFGVFALIETSV